MKKDLPRIGIFASGSATTACHVMKEIIEGRLGVTISCFIHSNPKKKGANNMFEAGLEEEKIFFVNPFDFDKGKDRVGYGNEQLRILKDTGTDAVFQLGHIPLTPPNVIDHFGENIFNQHPAPLDPGHPDFGGDGMRGMSAHCARVYFVRALKKEKDRDCLWTEATVHRVVSAVDKGAVVGRTRMMILPKESVTSVQERLLPIEYELVTETMRKFANGTLANLSREDRVVLPDELDILRRAKEAGAEFLFPGG